MQRRSISASNVTGKAPGPLEVMASAKWNRLALLNALIRPTLDYPFNQQVAERIAKRLDVHWVTVYRYRQRLLGGRRGYYDPRARSWISQGIIPAFT